MYTILPFLHNFQIIIVNAFNVIEEIIICKAIICITDKEIKLHNNKNNGYAGVMPLNTG